MYGSLAREATRTALRQEERSSVRAQQHLTEAIQQLHTRRQMVPQLQETYDALEKKLTTYQGAHSILEYRQGQRQLRQLKRQMAEALSTQDERALRDRAAPLLQPDAKRARTDVNAEQKLEALALSMFHRDKALPVYIAADVCTQCGTPWKMKAEESLLVCPNPECCRTSTFYHMATDHVDLEHHDTHASHNRSTLPQGVEAPTHAGVREQLYRQYLMQFCVEVARPPREIFELLLSDLSKIHVQPGTQVSVAAINNILKKNNKKEWLCMSHMIAMRLNQRLFSGGGSSDLVERLLSEDHDDKEPIPRFSLSLVQRLVERFAQIQTEATSTTTKARKQMISFRDYTKRFLKQEGEVALSELFDGHRTRQVMLREDQRFAVVCRALGPRGNWPFYRSV